MAWMHKLGVKWKGGWGLSRLHVWVGLLPPFCYCISFIGGKPSMWFLRLQSWKMSRRVSSHFHVETLWDHEMLRLCNFSNEFKLYGKLDVVKQESRSVVDLIVGSVFPSLLFFWKLWNQRNPDGPRLAVVTGEDSCFLCLLVCAFAIMVPTQNGPLRSDGKSGPGEALEQDNITLGFTLPRSELLRPDGSR